MGMAETAPKAPWWHTSWIALPGLDPELSGAAHWLPLFQPSFSFLIFQHSGDSDHFWVAATRLSTAAQPTDPDLRRPDGNHHA